MLKNTRVLITSGPTSVPIDDVRVLTNRSTGEMGRLLAAAYQAKGAKVTLLEGAVSSTLKLSNGIKVRTFFEYRELAVRLKEELKDVYDLVVHAAAVADYEPAKKVKGKLASGKVLTLKLKPTRKLVNEIKRSAPKALLVAFKLTPCMRPHNFKSYAADLFSKAKADLVLVNRQSANGYEALILRPDGTTTSKVRDKKSIVKVLLKETDELLKKGV